MLAHLSDAGMRRRHLSGVIERRKALSFGYGLDGMEAGVGDCLVPP